jgi:hypothetical protein
MVPLVFWFWFQSWISKMIALRSPAFGDNQTSVKAVEAVEAEQRTSTFNNIYMAQAFAFQHINIIKCWRPLLCLHCLHCLHWRLIVPEGRTTQGNHLRDSTLEPKSEHQGDHTTRALRKSMQWNKPIRGKAKIQQSSHRWKYCHWPKKTWQNTMRTWKHAVKVQCET